MMQRRIHAPGEFTDGFQAIRTELDVPPHFPPEVLATATTAQDRFAHERADRRSTQFVAVDPPGAKDLDQAFFAEETTDAGTARYRVHYAIADVAAFLKRGDPVDQEARRRGSTLYSPDVRTPLHPPVLSEDRASLLPGKDTPALLWQIDLDERGEPVAASLERALVHIAEAITYSDAQERIDAESDPSLSLLGTIGKLRQEREVERGGISLNLPSQEVVSRDGTYELEFDTALPVEGWNAQISLLTGIVAGRKMRDAKVGVLRTLPPPRQQDLRQLRREGTALGVKWPEDLSYPEMIRTVEPTTPKQAAFLLQAARSFRGAGYVWFDGELPDLSEHGAIASHYGHVTAPLRRLVDRFANEILLALYAGTRPSPEAVADLEELPSLMGRARSRESALERAMVDYAETMVLRDQVGQSFPAAVVNINDKRQQAAIQILEPAIESWVDADGLELGQSITVELLGVDTTDRTLTWKVTS